jgi:hypothetical protein
MKNTIFQPKSEIEEMACIGLNTVGTIENPREALVWLQKTSLNYSESAIPYLDKSIREAIAATALDLAKNCPDHGEAFRAMIKALQFTERKSELRDGCMRLLLHHRNDYYGELQKSGTSETVLNGMINDPMSNFYATIERMDDQAAAAQSKQDMSAGSQPVEAFLAQETFSVPRGRVGKAAYHVLKAFGKDIGQNRTITRRYAPPKHGL